MEKLSRTEKYKEYRNEINNTGEKEIATKELKELQDKLIINEKRFGNNSRTESDLNRGIKGSTLDDLYNIFGSSNSEPEKNEPQEEELEQESSFDTLEDIFSEIDKVDSTSKESLFVEEKDDYLKKIKEIVSSDIEKTPIQELDDNSYLDTNEKTEDIQPAEPVIDNTVKDEQSLDIDVTSEPLKALKEVMSSLEEEIAEFEEPKKEPEVEQVKTEEIVEPKPVQPQPQPSSVLKNVVLEKPVIKIPVPQEDRSKEFIEICENVNRLAAAIEENNTAFKENVVSTKTIANNTPVDLLQNDVKKEMLNETVKPSFMDNLENEVNKFNQMNDNKTIDNITNELIDNQRHSADQEGSIEDASLQKEFENTVSIEASKLREEINSFKADDISADEILNVNNLLKDNAENDVQEGKTIAFNLGKEEVSDTPEIPDNTIIMDKPPIDDSSIHTMSFRKEDLELENDEKSNTILNIILIVLIIVAVIALGAIVYFFLLTRGIL